MRPRTRLTEAERRALTLRQGELSALAQHPSWPLLEAEVERRQDLFAKEIAVKVLYGDGVDADRQAFMRGFMKGMRYLLAIPTGAEASLDRYLAQQERETSEVSS